MSPYKPLQPTTHHLADLWNAFRQNPEGGRAGYTCYHEVNELYDQIRAEAWDECARKQHDVSGLDMITDDLLLANPYRRVS